MLFLNSLCDGRGRVIRTLDPRFPKPVLYQAELYPENRLIPLQGSSEKGKYGTRACRY